MAIDKSGEFWTGSEFADLSEYIAEHTREGYLAEIVQPCVCKCGGRVFRLETDAGEGCARRICSDCRKRAFIADSKECWSVASPEACHCTCGGDRFEIGIGFSLRPDKEIRWITVGVRCVACGILGSPVDWSIHYGPTRHLFEQSPKTLEAPQPAAGAGPQPATSVAPPGFIPEYRDWIPTRQRELSFYALDAEVQDWLVRCLPPKYAPYLVVRADIHFVGEWKRVRQPFCFPPSEFVSQMVGPSGNRGDYWIWAPALTPDLDVERGYPVIQGDFGQICSVNGLLHLRHGLDHGGYRGASHLLLDASVRNFGTGATAEYGEYDEVFKALRKEINKALRYVTRTDAGEDAKLLVTEAAAREHGRSIHFDREPGEPTGKKPSGAR